MEELQFNGPGCPRLSAFILQQLPSLSPGLLHKYLRENKIKLNGKRHPLSTRLAPGDSVRLYLPDKGARHLAKGSVALPALCVLYEDENLLAVNKPAGLLCLEEGVHTGQDTLLLRAQRYWYAQPKGKDRTPDFPLSLCHRLDTGTSGVVLLAKNKAMLDFIDQLLREHQLQKRYLCVTIGKPRPPAASLHGFLWKDAKRGMVRISSQNVPGAKAIETRYETLASSGRFALLEVELPTGRTHQIRAHLAHIGTPVLGDSKYGLAAINREMKCRYQCLCAFSLTFPKISNPGFTAYSSLFITCEKPWYYGQVLDGTLQ